MGEGLLQLIVICIYLTLLLVLGYISSRSLRRTRDDYQLASHSIGPFLLLMSLFGTTMTGFALVGSSGEAFKEGIGVYGLLASSSGIVHSLCFFLIGVPVWKLARRYGYATQIQFFRDRLDNEFIGLLLFPVLVGLVIPYLLVGIIGGGSVIQSLTQGASPDLFPHENPAFNGAVPPWLGSAVVCAVVLVYVFMGGMRGTAWANAFQTAIFMSLGVITFVVIAYRLGGQDSLIDNLRALGDALPEDIATRSEMSRTKFLTYLLIPLSVGMFPHVFQHWLTARSSQSFKLPVIAHPIFIMIVWIPCVLVGAWATTGLVEPALEQAWDEFGRSGSPPPVPENPNAILGFLVSQLTSPLLGGLLAAGILAAIMSSLDSQFLCLGTMFTNDIVVHYRGRENVSDVQQVLLTRGFIIAIVIVSYLLSLGNLTSVFALGVWCFSGFSSLFPIAVAAIYWRRLSAAGAIAGVLAAIVSWCALFYLGVSSSAGLRAFELQIGGYVIMPVVLMVASSTAAMIAVTLVTPPPRDEVVRRFFDVR